MKLRFRNPFALSGRAGRREFAISAAILLGARFAVALWPFDPFAQAAATDMILLVLALRMVRRLHDVGRSGWWVLPILVAMWAMGFASILVTVAGPAPEVWPTIRRLPELALIAAAAALCVLPGQRDENRYGPPPGGLPFRDIFG